MRSKPVLPPALGAALVACALLAASCHQSPKLDPDYVLKPSSWQGHIRYHGKSYDFLLVIEHADDEIMRGRMEWSGVSTFKSVIGVQGSYRGNHLQFTETEVLRGPAEHLNPEDTKDVYIVGDTMIGTDKAGRAGLRATRVQTAAPGQTPPAPGQQPVAQPQPNPDPDTPRDGIPWPPAARAPSSISLDCPPGTRQGNPLQNLGSSSQQIADIEKSMGEHRCCLAASDGHVAGPCYRRYAPAAGSGIREHGEFLGQAAVGFYVAWHPNGVMQHRGRFDSRGQKQPGWQQWDDQGRAVNGVVP